MGRASQEVRSLESQCNMQWRLVCTELYHAAESNTGRSSGTRAHYVIMHYATGPKLSTYAISRGRNYIFTLGSKDPNLCKIISCSLLNPIFWFCPHWLVSFNLRPQLLGCYSSEQSIKHLKSEPLQDSWKTNLWAKHRNMYNLDFAVDETAWFIKASYKISAQECMEARLTTRCIF